MTVVNRYLTHAVVLVLVVLASGYATVGHHQAAPGTGVATLGTDASAAVLDTGGSSDFYAGRYNTIIKPLSIPTTAPPSHTASVYTVSDGETIADIAGRFGVTVDQLRWSNPILSSTDRLGGGVKLTIPPTPGVVVTTHAGDTVDSLAAKYKVAPAVIVDYNRIRAAASGSGDAALPEGEELVIPDGVGPLLPTTTVDTTGLAPAFVSRRGSFVVKYGAPVGTYANPRFPWGWCTWYVATRRDVTWSGDAYEWYANAKAAGYAVGSTPRAGAVMVTWESGWGHVAYVESVAADGSWIVSEMNYVGFGVASQRQISPGAVPLIGFIY